MVSRASRKKHQTRALRTTALSQRTLERTAEQLAAKSTREISDARSVHRRVVTTRARPNVR
eukprot:3166219-Lingulodinium_polyedra.AAC.1